jgi:hypothetical protein
MFPVQANWWKFSATNLKNLPPLYDCVPNVRALLFAFFDMSSGSSHKEQQMTGILYFARMNVFIFLQFLFRLIYSL